MAKRADIRTLVLNLTEAPAFPERIRELIATFRGSEETCAKQSVRP